MPVGVVGGQTLISRRFVGGQSDQAIRARRAGTTRS